MRKIRTFLSDLFFSTGIKINLILIMIFICIVSYTIYSQRKVEVYSSMFENQVKTNSTILSLKDNLRHSEEYLRAYLSNGNRAQLTEFNDTVLIVYDQLDSLNATLKEEESRYLLQSIQTTFDNYFAECCQASFNFNTNNYEYYSRMYSSEVMQSYLQKYCDELLLIVLEKGEAENLQLTNEVRIMRNVSLLFLFFFIFFVFIFILYVNNNVTRPLRNLVLSARKISKGDFSCKVKPLDKNNSMSLLITTFNEMSEDISSMMDKLKKQVITEKKLFEEKKKNEEYHKLLSEAKFLALQSQTNPHFLFNTLNSISRMIILDEKESSLEMIDSLSQLLRYNLSDCSKPVSLFLEIVQTKEYISIQKKRFNNRLNVLFDIDERLSRTVFLPKFTLQPLVENAIIHGLEPKQCGGIIKILAKEKNGKAIIRIYDNGVGIDKKTLGKLKRSTSFDKKRNHIGYKNTRDRLNIFTKRKNSISIISKEGLGTIITIKIPIPKGVDNV